jgi:hypothetical protein
MTSLTTPDEHLRQVSQTFSGATNPRTADVLTAAVRQEFILLSDTLGVSMLIEMIACGRGVRGQRVDRRLHACRRVPIRRGSRKRLSAASAPRSG